MTGQNRDVVSERKQFSFDSIEKHIRIAARQVPTPHTAGKKHVTANEQFFFAQEEAKTARGMTRHVEDFEGKAEKFACGRFLNQQIGLSWFDIESEAKVPKKIRLRNHRHRLRMAANWTTKAPLDFGHVGNVVDMAVREQQKFELNATGNEPVAGAIRRIEQQRPLRRV